MNKIYQKSFSGEQTAGKYGFVSLKESFTLPAVRMIVSGGMPVVLVPNRHICFVSNSPVISVLHTQVIAGVATYVIHKTAAQVIPEVTTYVIPEGCSRESRCCETIKRLGSPTETFGDDGRGIKRLGPSNPAGCQTLGNDAVRTKRLSRPTRTFGNDAVPVRRRGTAGFTLIELLVVVLIIGILSAIALPFYKRAVEKARAMQAVTVVRSTGEAAERYWLENGTYPFGTNGVLQQDVLDIVPPAIKYFELGGVYSWSIYARRTAEENDYSYYYIAYGLKHGSSTWKGKMLCYASDSDYGVKAQKACRALCGNLETVRDGWLGCFFH